jgi:hypothetical protein
MIDHIIQSADGQTYDLTTNRIAFGLLPKDVQDAMKAWPHGWEIYYLEWDICWPKPAWLQASTYRARPAPKVTEYVLYWEVCKGMAASTWKGNYDTHRILIRDDGKGNLTATVEKL